ncbi:MAG: YveK family protein [Patescibacteria group bacterium]|jgi:capsular polysaccharide biosynthesis protein|nr:hypothetical protein [bacterium]HQC49624.1 hypothetical protein [bacterium]
MEFNDFLQLIRKKKQTIIIIMLISIMSVLLVSVIQPLKYSVSSRLLVIQNTTETDAYALSRSNEYLGNLLAEVVYSSSFYEQVRASKYNIDENYFSGNYNQQLKIWNKTVNTRAQGDTGIIDINVYHPNVSEAKKIALAVNDILINRNQEYQGGQNIKINIIDQPLASLYPTKPNIPFNLAATFFLSFILALIYIYLFPEEKYSLSVFNSKKTSYLPELEYQKLRNDEQEMIVRKMKQKYLINTEDEMNEQISEQLENSDFNGNIENNDNNDNWEADLEANFEAKVEDQKKPLSGNIRNLINR